jgi:hypothetical protein
LVTKYEDIYRLKLGAYLPANVKLLVIKLRDGAKPVRISARKYATLLVIKLRDGDKPVRISACKYATPQ